MIRRVLVLMRQDLIVAWRSHFVTFLLLILALFVGLYYALPDDISRGPRLLIHDRSGALEGSGGGSEEATGIAFVDSRAALERSLSEARGATGLIVDGPADTPTVTILSEGAMSDERLNTLKASLAELLPAIATQEQPPEAAGSTERDGGTRPFTITTLEPDRPALTASDLLIPVGLVFEVLLLGFLFVAVMVFQERQEGSFRAYRTTPAGAWAYVLGKVGLWTLLTSIYGLVFALLTIRFAMPLARWLPLLALILAGGACMTALGYLVSLFFSGISDWFFIGVGILVLNMLPQISFVMPAFSPRWLRFIPSEPALFATRDVVFGTGGWSAVAQPTLLYAAAAAVITAIAVGVTRLRLFREE